MLRKVFGNIPFDSYQDLLIQAGTKDGVEIFVTRPDGNQIPIGLTISWILDETGGNGRKNDCF